MTFVPYRKSNLIFFPLHPGKKLRFFLSLLLISGWGIVWEGRDDDLGGYLVVLAENTLLIVLLILFYFNKTVSTRHGVFLSMMVLFSLTYFFLINGLMEMGGDIIFKNYLFSLSFNSHPPRRQFKSFPGPVKLCHLMKYCK